MRRMFSENQINKIAKSSGSATNGKVLTADGNGGSSWQSAGGGGGTSLYKHSFVKGDYFIMVVSKDSTAYTDINSLCNAIAGASVLSISVIDNDIGNVGLCSAYTSAGGSSFDIISGTSISVNFSTSDTINDTVTTF